MIAASLDEIRFDEQGLVPVVVRDMERGDVGMLAWADRAALERTVATGEATFWSRSRGCMWVKGMTSGNRIAVAAVRTDCDFDAVVYEGRLAGPACHTGERSCFFRAIGPAPQETPAEAPKNFDLAPLFEVLASRRRERPEGSYSAKLFDRGLDHILKKVGEEAAEVIVAMKNPDDAALAGEIGDLLFHLAAAMVERGISAEDVNEVLLARRK